jgi:hypothetical protein
MRGVSVCSWECVYLRLKICKCKLIRSTPFKLRQKYINSRLGGKLFGNVVSELYKRLSINELNAGEGVCWGADTVCIVGPNFSNSFSQPPKSAFLSPLASIIAPTLFQTSYSSLKI